MSPTTFRDGQVIEHEGDAPPADIANAVTMPAAAPDIVSPPKPARSPRGRTAPAPKAPRARTAKPVKAAKPTRAVKAAETQRKTRLGKHKK